MLRSRTSLQDCDPKEHPICILFQVTFFQIFPKSCQAITIIHIAASQKIGDLHNFNFPAILTLVTTDTYHQVFDGSHRETFSRLQFETSFTKKKRSGGDGWLRPARPRSARSRVDDASTTTKHFGAAAQETVCRTAIVYITAGLFIFRDNSI